MLVYHATFSEPFQRFDLSRSGSRLTLSSSGLGIFFSPSDDVRHSYGRNVMRGYLRIERPYVMPLASLNRLKREDVASFRAELERKEHDGIIAMVGQKPWEYVVFQPDQVHLVDWGQARNEAPYAVQWPDR